MARALITIPTGVRRGEAIEIRTLIAHPMETGYRPAEDGRLLPRNLIRRLSCHYNDELVFSAEMFPATAANPFVSFYTLAVASGTLRFTWEGDNGFTQTETRQISVA